MHCIVGTQVQPVLVYVIGADKADPDTACIATSATQAKHFTAGYTDHKHYLTNTVLGRAEGCAPKFFFYHEDHILSRFRFAITP